MKTGRKEATILVIDSDASSLATIQGALAEEFQRIETACCLAEAEQRMSGRNVDLVICEINAGCIDGDIFASVERASWPGEILFLSDGQKAAVAFREFSGGPRFCVQKQHCRELLLLIAKQALRLSASQQTTAANVNPPRVPVPTLTYPVAATNIHSLY